ncbi:MAG: IS21 family transposase [Saprospiraceae bacterium]
MNKFENSWIVYHQIHLLNKTGMKPPQIGREVVMDTRTVKKILSMSEQEFIESKEKGDQRFKKLDQYEEFVRQRLDACPQASAAQVYDWLKECHNDFIDVAEKTVYNFVSHIREKFSIIKEFEKREYTKVPELPYGKQSQVDFGEFNMTTVEGQRKKVYFFAMVLSRSRYKFVFFSAHPFTTNTAIEAHEKAFTFIDGYPQEVAYDQDRVLLTNENRGNLILTEAFSSYHAHRQFGLRFCRKSDPESKGKVESIIKYIKYNFLRGRIFYDIHVLNSQALEWLDRTANAKKHSTTKLVPAIEWIKEKAHLTHLSVPFLIAQGVASYKVRKDNTISFKGNFYTVPVGTYQGPDTTVFLLQENETLIIQTNEKQEIARHQISLIKGKLISNSNHYRDQSIKIRDYIELVAEKFSDNAKAVEYMEKVRDQNPRYVRDQIQIIQLVCEKYYLHQRDVTLQYCLENNIFRAVDFEPVLIALDVQNEDVTDNIKTNLLQKEQYQVIPQVSNISDYNKLLN